MPQEPIELKKRLEEVRLLESRRSARLADQDRDTDFARLADMGGDRRRTSHSIEVPLSLTQPQHNARKRPPSYTHDFSGDQCNEEEMNACNAALILMKLSNSPKSPQNGEKWLGSSPGSSSASWSSGSSSPPLSDDGNALHTNAILLAEASASARIRTTSVSTSDEGIVVDFKEEAPRKKRANKSRFLCTWKGCNFIEHTPPKIERHIRNVHLGNKKARRTDYEGSFSDSDHEEEFYYTEIEDDDDEGKAAPSPTSPPTLSHRDMARPPHEDPEYQRQIVGNFKQGRAAAQHQHHNNNNGKSVHHSNITYTSNSSNNCMPTSPLAHHNYTWPSSAAAAPAAAAVATQSTAAAPTATLSNAAQQQHSPSVTYIKHARSSPRPSQSAAPYPSPTYVHHHHHNYSSSSSVSSNAASPNGSPNSPNCITHSNSSANNVLQQLSQQNVTVTAHRQQPSAVISNSHNQQQQLSAVTITPNYHPHPQQLPPPSQQQQQQHIHGGHQPQPTTTATTTASNHQHQYQHHSHHQQSQQHIAVQHAIAAAKHAPNSPNRRTRGENKKCRKVYGMDRRDQWCTQCRWKKACSRFGD